jgi:hypothetical protein
MPNTNDYPFRRIVVDHLVRGGTRIWWWLDPRFNDPGPHVFQLQVSDTGLATARDWQNVGTRITDGFTATDDAQRARGKNLTPHYRVALTTSRGVYVSEPASVLGELTEADLVLAREILRKEQLRGRKKSWRPGTLHKRMQYGAACTRCRDSLTGETMDSDCPECAGTGIQEGYHPAVPLCIEFTTDEYVDETTDPEIRGSINDVEVVGRCLAFPMLRKNDIWVDGRSDKRYIVGKITYKTAIRGVPLVIHVNMKLAPFSDRIYSLGCPAEETLPGAGTGCVEVTQDYGTAGAFAYHDAEGAPIAGADVIAFTKPDADAAHPNAPIMSRAIAATHTDDDGNWTAALHLDPGSYVLVFRKEGLFGPDFAALTVARPAGSALSSSANSAWDP